MCSDVLAVGCIRCGAIPRFRRFRRDWITACSLNSSTISSGELNCTPIAFRLVEHTNRKAGIMQHSTIAVRQISRCYNERPVIYKSRNIHTSSSRRTLPVTEISPFLRKDCLAPNVRHMWLVGSLCSWTGVHLSCRVSFSESILPYTRILT